MIRKLAKTAVMAVVLGGLTVTVAAPAEAQANGLPCRFTSVTDPTIENGEVQTGQINGGPIVATAPGATISMKCTLQVGAANSTHNGADSASVSSMPTLQVTSMPPSAVSYLSPEGQPVYMCTEITVNGVTYYWDATNPGPAGNGPAIEGQWSTSSSVSCREAITQEIFPGPLAPVIDLLTPIIDGAVCPILASLAPGIPGVVDIDGTGDTYVGGVFVWDCPPYVE